MSSTTAPDLSPQPAGLIGTQVVAEPQTQVLSNSPVCVNPAYADRSPRKPRNTFAARARSVRSPTYASSAIRLDIAQAPQLLAVSSLVWVRFTQRPWLPM